MFTYVRKNIKRDHICIFPQAIIHFLFALSPPFKIEFAKSIQLPISIFNDSSILIAIALTSLVCLILPKADAKLLKKQLFNDF